jgi:hypothetical protein
VTLEERMELLARLARGDETEEKVDREGLVIQVAPAMKDRLAAIKLLSELSGDMARAKAPPAKEEDDDVSRMSSRQLLLELEKLQESK